MLSHAHVVCAHAHSSENKQAPAARIFLINAHRGKKVRTVWYVRARACVHTVPRRAGSVHRNCYRNGTVTKQNMHAVQTAPHGTKMVIFF